MSRPVRNARGKVRPNYAELDDAYTDREVSGYTTSDLTLASAAANRQVADEMEFSEDDELSTAGRNKKRKRGDGSSASNAARARNNKNTGGMGEDDLNGDEVLLDHSTSLQLKSDHSSRPIWVAQDGVILLEAFSPLYQQAYDFLVAVAEPVARPKYVHKYQLTRNSLYSAVSINIDTETILSVMRRLCKTDLPEEVDTFVRECTSTFGKAKLVLKENNFFVESAHPDVLRKLLAIPSIAAARVATSSSSLTSSNEDGFLETEALQELKENLNFTEVDGGMVADADDSDEDELEMTEQVPTHILPIAMKSAVTRSIN